MSFLSFIQESFFGSIKSVWYIARIIIPLMVIMEILKDLNILDRLTDRLSPLSKFLGISKESTFPLIIGLLLGLSYGTGIIIKSAREGQLSKRDLYLLIIFLISCHSVIEDTLLFMTVGANGWLLLTFRISIGIIITVLISRNIDKILKTN